MDRIMTQNVPSPSLQKTSEEQINNYLCDLHKNPVIDMLCDALVKVQNALPEHTKGGLYICSGALFQTIWNLNSGRHPMYGISDIDIIWFDPEHTTYNQENIVIEAIRTFAKPYLNGIKIDAKNQARVHLWTQERYGITKEPYHNIEQVIESTTSIVQATALHIDRHGKKSILAPYGIQDIYDMVVRENPKTEHPHSFFIEKAARWKQLWPQITVIDTPPTDAHDQQPVIVPIDTLANTCGYFFNHSYDNQEAADVNNGYNCSHPDCGEIQDGVGCCLHFSCPLAYTAENEDLPDGYDEDGEYMVITDPSLAERLKDSPQRIN